MRVKKQIPNILTVVRLVLALLCAYFALNMDKESLIISFALFMIASATDYLDGYLARKWNIVSTFGKFIDPIADKVLILGVLIVFSYKGVIPWYLTAIVAFREVSLTIIRTLLMFKKVVIASTMSGKVKTFSQVIAIIIIYVIVYFRNQISHTVFQYIIWILMVWIVVTTIYSGVRFVIKNRKEIEKLAIEEV